MEFWALKKDQIRDAVNANYQLQYGEYLNEVIDIPGGKIAISKHIDDTFIWNHAALGSVANDGSSVFVKQAKSILVERGRSLATYISPVSESVGKVVSLLKNEGLEQVDEEAWMFYLHHKPPKLELPKAVKMEQVKTQNDLDTFINLFYRSYEGVSGVYKLALNEQFADYQAMKGVQHFILFVDGTPTSIGTVISRNGYSAIYSVGTPSEYRNKGYGGMISTHCIIEGLRSKPNLLFLQAWHSEEGGPEPLYRRLGFCTVFVRIGFASSH